VLTHRGREDARRSVFERQGLDPAEPSTSLRPMSIWADLQLTLT
jgi:hypothetical protein